VVCGFDLYGSRRVLLCWQYWIFEQSEDAVPVCEFVTLETIDTDEGTTPFCGVFRETSLYLHLIKALPNENRRLLSVIANFILHPLHSCLYTFAFRM